MVATLEHDQEKVETGFPKRSCSYQENIGSLGKINHSPPREQPLWEQALPAQAEPAPASAMISPPPASWLPPAWSPPTPGAVTAMARSRPASMPVRVAPASMPRPAPAS